MISIRRIAHATFETPDVDKLIDYYTNVIGLSLVAREKDGAYLAGVLNHAVVLRKGDTARCARISFQIAPDDDLAAFEKQLNGHGLKTQRKKDPEPGVPEFVSFEDPKGTLLEVSNVRAPAKIAAPAKGLISPFKLGHVAFNVVDVKKITNFYCDVLGFRVSDWFADFFSFLRCGPDHHTINLLDSKAGEAEPRGVRAARLEPPAERLRLSRPQRLFADLGPGAARARSQSLLLSQEPGRPHRRVVRRARPDARRVDGLLRAEAVAQGSSAEAERYGRSIRSRPISGALARRTR